jgi:ankyrin repeat protein
VLKGHTFSSNWNLLIPPHVFVGDHTLVIGLGDPPRAVPTTDFLPAIDYPALAPIERLIVATQYGRLDIVQDVLRNGVDVNGRNANGVTPLFEAVAQDHAEIAELLLNSGASPGRSVGNGLTPVCLALLSGHIDSLRVLIKHGANVQRSPGINPNCDTTPLILAITRLGESAALEVVGPLLEAGADPLLDDTEGNAIEHARRVGYTKLERLLVQHVK